MVNTVVLVICIFSGVGAAVVGLIIMVTKNHDVYDYYLAGPMRGHKDLNEKEFTRTATALRKRGFTVFNPSEVNDVNLSFAECMGVDLDVVVNRCNKIAILKGWRDSIGSNGEVFAAFMTGKTVFEIDLDSKPGNVLMTTVDTGKFCLPYKTVGQKLHPVPGILTIQSKKLN